MPILMCFGDSNTHGTPPIVQRGVYARYDAATRWPTRAAALLGPDWDLVEEGLPGRTSCFDDPMMGDHMNAVIGMRIALNSHGPLEYMTIMLGTNDVKTRFGASAERIVAGIAGLVDMALAPDMAARHPGLRILLIAPPPVQELGPLTGEFIGGAAKGAALAGVLGAYAAARGLGFLDAGTVLQTSPIDGVHYAPEGHAALAIAAAKALKSL
ncbi:GDSL-type esterase/lipase family protein [Pseudorhodobacter ferrugineus]|uniref:GDSL-type esterase/lipase family protein n=1 Tax=Pseudorhodobacter ferrugineus TaxID=77008 RepID=UPI0003B4E3C2|nr:GDSL-type esterase/lipase family protein [Pseudorhodobacter ferrugineus]